MRAELSALVRRNWLRFTKFLSTGFVAFLFSELVVYSGMFIFGLGRLIYIDVAAGIGSIALGYWLNNIWTTRNSGHHSSTKKGFLAGLAAYEALYAAGNVVAYAIQLFLFYRFSLNPLIGNIAGAVVATPINYVLTMSLIWRIKIFSD